MAKKKKSKKSTLTVLVVAALTVIAGLVLLITYGDTLFKKKPVETARLTAEVSVYFTDPDGESLKAEPRRIGRGTLDAEIKEALKTLLDGSTQGLTPPVPAGTRLLKVEIKDSIAFVDLSREVVENHPGGSTGELLTVYSIVDTVTLNFPQIKEVQILVEGKRVDTLAGHIELTVPLGPDTDMIKGYKETGKGLPI